MKPKEIVEAFAEYYKDLYDNCNSDSDHNNNETKTFFEKIHLPTLSREEASKMIQPVSPQEVIDNINS